MSKKYPITDNKKGNGISLKALVGNKNLVIECNENEIDSVNEAIDLVNDLIKNSNNIPGYGTALKLALNFAIELVKLKKLAYKFTYEIEQDLDNIENKIKRHPKKEKKDNKES